MGFFSNKKSDEQTKPKTVPEEATWNEENNEWEIGNYDNDGNMIGEWKWWLAPTGHLCCHSIFKEDGSGDMAFTRFHPDGTISMKGTYIDGVQHGVFISQQSKNETPENYNPSNGFKAVTTFEEGYIIEEHYFDENDNEIDEPYISDNI